MLSVPHSASFVYDRTLLPDESVQEELSRLQNFVRHLQEEEKMDPRTKVIIRPRFRPTPACEAYCTDPNNVLVQKMLAAIAAQGSSYSFGIGRSVADENRIALSGIPTITLGPTGAGSHTPSEWVDPASLERVAEIYQRFLAEC